MKTRKRDSTGANRGNGEPKEYLCSLGFLLLKSERVGGEIGFNLGNSEGINLFSKRGRDANFNFLARDTQPHYVDHRLLLEAGKPELREYKGVFAVGDEEVRQFSDEITVNCVPLV